MSKQPLYPHVPKGKKIGYRRGAVGDYMGLSRAERADARIAWKALTYEYSELGNEHILTDVAHFLHTPVTTWDRVVNRFRVQYGDIPGIWLSSSRKSSELYAEYGDIEAISYDPDLVVIPDQGDGFFVLDRRIYA